MKMKNNRQELYDMLLLVGADTSKEVIREWEQLQCVEAMDWALKAHLSAADNNVKVPPMPKFVKFRPLNKNARTVMEL